MGDGTNDAYAQIRNQVSPATQNITDEYGQYGLQRY